MTVRPKIFLLVAVMVLFLSQCCSWAKQPSLSVVVPNGFGVNIKSANMASKECDLIAKAGFKWVRFDLHWHVVEKQPGIYVFDGSEQNYDRLVRNMNARGIRVLFILAYGNPLYDGGVAPYTPSGRKAYARFAAASAQHFARQDVWWEIWNEPNQGDFWRLPPGKYTDLSAGQIKAAGWAKLSNAAIPAMRQANPHAFIIGPALSNLLPETLNFLKTIGKTDALHKLDAISVHPYRDYWPETVRADYVKLRSMLGKMKIKAPIVNSEQGYTTAMLYGNHGGRGKDSGFGLRRLSPDQQASYLVRLYLTDLYNGVNNTIWYAWPDEGDNPDDAAHRFGIVSIKGQPKPPFYAAHTFTSSLNAFRYVGRVTLSKPQDWMLKFTKNKTDAFVLWTEEDQTPHQITLGLRGKYKVVKLYGETTLLQANGRQIFTITTEPQYLIKTTN
jgi:hypothetical protein